MKHLLTFDGTSVGLTHPYQYQIMHLDTINKVMLWYKAPGECWEIGHSKEIPAHMSAEDVARIMREYVLGDLHCATYNEMLP